MFLFGILREEHIFQIRQLTKKFRPGIIFFNRLRWLRKGVPYFQFRKRSNEILTLSGSAHLMKPK